MSSWKTVFTIVGVAGFAFVSLDMPRYLVEMFPGLTEFMTPFLAVGSPFKSIVAVVSLLLLSLGVIPTSDPEFSRGDFLQTVSLGCAIVVAACLSMAIHFSSGDGPVLPGLVMSVAVIQAGVGIFAAAVLSLDSRTRPLSKFPMSINVGLCALTLAYSFGPLV
ncbi:MAG: hypothetical protein H8E43_09485 [Planctomycetia bacterium]|nr:hypothetical protein [Planctomycetia bacterium]MBL6915657.1 hypothetical protein [Planctomycetota bacterium]